MLLLHAGINTGMVLLPIMPAVVGDTRPLVIAYGLQNIVAILVVAFSGVNLGRKPARRAQSGSRASSRD